MMKMLKLKEADKSMAMLTKNHWIDTGIVQPNHHFSDSCMPISKGDF